MDTNSIIYLVIVSQITPISVFRINELEPMFGNENIPSVFSVAQPLGQRTNSCNKFLPQSF